MSYITVQHFYDLTELTLARVKLEQEGIATITKDEQTMQVLSAIEARAIGGAKLQVSTEDYRRASQLMIDLGFMTANSSPTDFWIVNVLDNYGKMIFGTEKLPKEMRVVLISFLLVVIPFMMVILYSIMTFS